MKLFLLVVVLLFVGAWAAPSGTSLAPGVAGSTEVTNSTIDIRFVVPKSRFWFRLFSDGADKITYASILIDINPAIKELAVFNLRSTNGNFFSRRRYFSGTIGEVVRMRIEIRSSTLSIKLNDKNQFSVRQQVPVPSDVGISLSDNVKYASIRRVYSRNSQNTAGGVELVSGADQNGGAAVAGESVGDVKKENVDREGVDMKTREQKDVGMGEEKAEERKKMWKQMYQWKIRSILRDMELEEQEQEMMENKKPKSLLDIIFMK